MRWRRFPRTTCRVRCPHLQRDVGSTPMVTLLCRPRSHEFPRPQDLTRCAVRSRHVAVASIPHLATTSAVHSRSQQPDRQDRAAPSADANGTPCSWTRWTGGWTPPMAAISGELVQWTLAGSQPGIGHIVLGWCSRNGWGCSSPQKATTSPRGGPCIFGLGAST
jgi:hypothetical protein